MNIRLFLVLALALLGTACDKIVREARTPQPIGDAQLALAPHQ
jgi:hypothetical protein